MRLLEVHSEKRRVEFFQIVDLSRTLGDLRIEVAPASLIVIYHINLTEESYDKFGKSTIML